MKQRVVVFAVLCSLPIRAMFAPTPFQIRVFDVAGRPLPNVALTTDDGERFITQDTGVYIWRSAMMHRDITFHIDGDGSAKLHIIPGGHASLTLRR